MPYQSHGQGRWAFIAGKNGGERWKNDVEMVVCLLRLERAQCSDVELAGMFYSLYLNGRFPSIDFILFFSRRQSHDIQRTYIFFHRTRLVASKWNCKAFEHVGTQVHSKMLGRMNDWFCKYETLACHGGWVCGRETKKNILHIKRRYAKHDATRTETTRQE